MTFKLDHLIPATSDIRLNLIVAVSYFILGYLGTQLALPPSHVSPIWPASGLALSVMLVYGKRVLPGLFTGIFAVQIYAFLDFSQPESLLPTLITSTFGSFGSSLQSWLGAYLIRLYVGSENPLIDDKAILNFFIYGALLSSLVAPSIGIGTIFLQGFITLQDIPISGLTWWIGDVIGVIIFAPIILSFIGQPESQWQARRKLVAYPLMLVFALVLIIFQYNKTQEFNRIRTAFEQQVSVFHTTFSTAIQRDVEINQIIKAFFDSSSFVTQTDFAKFTQLFINKHINIQALEWIRYIPKAERDVFESSGLIIREPNAEKQMISATERAEYFPITYVQPETGNERAMGFDVGSNPDALSALSKARETGQTSMTRPVQLVQDLQQKQGFVLYSPVYRSTVDHNLSSELKSELMGFVAGVFRASDEVQFVFDQSPHLQLWITMEDSGIEFFNNMFKPETQTANLLALKTVIPLHLADRVWNVTYQPSDDFYSEQMSWTLWWILLGGLSITALTGISLMMLTGRTLSIEELVHLRTQELAASKERFQTIFNEAPLGVCVMDSTQRHIYEANRAYEQITGRSVDDLKTLDGIQITHPEDRQHYADHLKRIRDTNASGITLQKRDVRPDGTICWVNVTLAPMGQNNENQSLCLCLTEDITERKLAEEKLQLSAKVFSETHEGIAITNASGNIIDVNPAFCEITGYTLAEVMGKKPSLLSSGRHSLDFYRDMWQTIHDQGYWQGEIWNRSKDGRFYAELLSISSITDQNGRVTHYIGIFTDITHIKKQQETLEQMAHYDVLTKLPNRMLLSDRFLQALAHSKRTHTFLAVCFIDLDHFKPVNDMYGHEIGDELLIRVAHRIKTNIREEDTASRQGGDEFVLLLGDIASITQCKHILNRIIHSLTQPYLIDEQSITIGASMGVTLYPEDNSDLDTLMRHADYAMYQAKSMGRNRYRFFNPEQDQLNIQKNIQLEEIQKALENNELCLFYQPKVNMATGCVYGAEALIRWIHPEKGLIPPLQFLPVLEETELEIRIGEWVIEQALKQLAIWQTEQIELVVSVNISSYHLQSPQFIKNFETVLSQYPQIESKYLQLEILESSVLSDLNLIRDVITQCIHTLGISIALDDFGTGYSSLTHLRNLPCETIKIDQVFVRDLLDDPNDYAIIDSVIGLSESFNREVIAEGVETTQHGLALLAMGCHNAQGYGIARPMPAQEMATWLKHYRPNSEWLESAATATTSEENKIILLRLTFAQWQHRLINAIQSNPDQVNPWPILKSSQCHCGIWLKRALKENRFDPQWLKALEKEHEYIHDLANELYLKYQNQDINGIAKQRRTFEESAIRFDALAQFQDNQSSG